MIPMASVIKILLERRCLTAFRSPVFDTTLTPSCRRSGLPRCCPSPCPSVVSAQGAVRREVRGQVLPGVGQVAGRRTKTGRNKGAALALD